jgi:hypothetical protein
MRPTLFNRRRVTPAKDRAPHPVPPFTQKYTENGEAVYLPIAVHRFEDHRTPKRTLEGGLDTGLAKMLKQDMQMPPKNPLALFEIMVPDCSQQGTLVVTELPFEILDPSHSRLHSMHATREIPQKLRG